MEQKTFNVSLILEKLDSITTPKLSSRKFEAHTYRINTNRARTSFNSPRPQNPLLIFPKSNQQTRKPVPYPGLSIGLIKLENRQRTAKQATIPPIKYTNYFDDIYLNSESISFPKTKTQESIPELKENINFIIPNRLNFRRLKKKG